jgi:hypothetical protein
MSSVEVLIMQKPRMLWIAILTIALVLGMAAPAQMAGAASATTNVSATILAHTSLAVPDYATPGMNIVSDGNVDYESSTETVRENGHTITLITVVFDG